MADIPGRFEGVTRGGRWDPASLVRSYFRGDAPGAGTGTWQGCVVAEPHPGVYLVELTPDRVQRLVTVETMTEAGWQFWDWPQEAPDG